MNLFEMARRALVNDLIGEIPVQRRLELIEEMVEDLERQARELRARAEAIVCCNGRCNQGRDCPLRKR
jgi:F0F1-type ATP synthase delta subunit